MRGVKNHGVHKWGARGSEFESRHADQNTIRQYP